MRIRTLLLILCSILILTAGAVVWAASWTDTNGALVADGAIKAPLVASSVWSGDTYAATVVDDCYGTQVFLTHADAVAITIEDPDATSPRGTWIEFVWDGDDSLAVTIATTSVDTLVTSNDVQADSITFGSGHRKGAAVRFVSDGTAWHVFNINAGATMTVNS